MGLLSDPEYGSVKWVRVLKRIHGPVCFLCYVGALVWFVTLANNEFNNETYFSENALLPGLVTNEFNGEQSAKQFYNKFLQELEDKYVDTHEIPVPWLVAKMSQLHLEVYTQNFTLNYPLGLGQVYKGTNVYGILRAARTSSLEAVVVTAPYRAISSHQKGTAAGIALMLAFAEFARPQKYWAKDIIFLITEHEQLGMQAWLEAYHGLQSEAPTFYTVLGSFWKPGSPSLDLTKLFDWGTHKKCLDPGKLKGRSGSIQAAINLEFHTPKIKYIEVKIEGLNGQLPNLDLVNLVHKLCVKSGIHHSYKNSYSWLRNRNKMDEWANGIKTMLGMVSAQIAGVPNGNHGLFHRFGIEAVTLEGREASDPAGSPPRVNALTPANFYRLGIALESILRSLNNLLERFHQSYFFYMLAASNRFISIGQYMPSLCLLCVALLIRALSLWVSLQQETEEDPEKPENSPEKLKHSPEKSENSPEKSEISPEKTEKSAEKPKNSPEKVQNEKEKLSDSESKTPGDETVKELLPNKTKSPKKAESSKKVAQVEDSSISLVNIGAHYLLLHMLGYAVGNMPVMLSELGSKYANLPPEVSVYHGFIVVSGLLMIWIPAFPRLFFAMTYEDISLINILLLIELATVCLSVGMHNFPLGFAIAALYTPLALVISVNNGGGKKGMILVFLKRVLCVLLQPLFAVTLFMMSYCQVLFPEENILSMVTRGRDAAMQATMFSVVDSMIYGNWLFNVVTSVILPMWLIIWQILCNCRYSDY